MLINYRIATTLLSHFTFRVDLVKKSRNCSKNPECLQSQKTEIKGILATNSKAVLCIKLNKVQSVGRSHMTHNCSPWKLLMGSEKFLFWESSWYQQFFPLQSSRTWCSFYCQHSTAGSQGTISCLKRERPEGSCYQWVIAVICTWVKLIWIQYLSITLRRISFWVEDVKMVLPKDLTLGKVDLPKVPILTCAFLGQSLYLTF